MVILLTTIATRLYMLNILGIQEWKTHELCLVQVHHEQFVRGRQLHVLGSELLVKIADILSVCLQIQI